MRPGPVWAPMTGVNSLMKISRQSMDFQGLFLKDAGPLEGVGVHDVDVRWFTRCARSETMVSSLSIALALLRGRAMRVASP